MLMLDRSDPLDRMILQELSGTPVLFDEWLDAMDELADEPDCEQLLRERGLSWEAALRDAEAYRADFRARLEARGLPYDDRFALCRRIAEQAQAEPPDGLLKIYCELLSAPDFLLDKELDGEQMIWQFLHFAQERDVLQIIRQQNQLAGKFARLVKEKRSPRPGDCDTRRNDEILQCFTALFDMPPKGKGDILLYNLAQYMRLAAGSPLLRSVEPLLIFRLLTRRRSYMCSIPDLSVDLSALWKRDKNRIDGDNGKNFKQCRANLQLFQGLCRIYARDADVDLPLCWYGLDRITVLGDFYRQEVSLGWTCADEEIEYPFPPTIEELVEDAMFSCFEHGGGDNILLEDSGISIKELWDFQCSGRPLTASALDKLSDYMNRHAAELTEQFLRADANGVKKLCRDILEHVSGGMGASERDIPFLLSSINEGLMELQDYFACQYLIEAGQALTAGALTGTSEWSE